MIRYTYLDNEDPVNSERVDLKYYSNIPITQLIATIDHKISTTKRINFRLSSHLLSWSNAPSYSSPKLSQTIPVPAQ